MKTKRTNFRMQVRIYSKADIELLDSVKAAHKERVKQGLIPKNPAMNTLLTDILREGLTAYLLNSNVSNSIKTTIEKTSKKEAQKTNYVVQKSVLKSSQFSETFLGSIDQKLSFILNIMADNGWIKLSQLELASEDLKMDPNWIAKYKEELKSKHRNQLKNFQNKKGSNEIEEEE